MPLRKKATGKRKQKTRKHKSYKKHRGGQTSPPVSTFHFYNEFHYGDNILNLKFFYNISKILKEKNIQIHYYYSYDYIKNKEELERYVDPAVVILHDISEKPENTIQLWMGNTIENITHADFDKYFRLFYKNILKYLGLQDLPIDTSLYQKEDYLLDIYARLNSKFHDVHVLILNNPPASGQFDFNQEKIDALADRLSKQFKVVVLKPVNDIPSTSTDGLKLQDIGAISTHVKYIIGMNSGPLIPCFNSYTKESVKKWIIYNKHTEQKVLEEVDILLLSKPENINSTDQYII